MARMSQPSWKRRTPVKLFAVLADRLGTDQVTVPTPPGSTARSVLERLAWEYPQIAAQLAACRVARDDAFLEADEVVRAGEPLAIIPPTSGG